MAEGRWRMTSVLVARKGRPKLYSATEDMPAELRASMEKALQGDLSATILIADQDGRREITRLLKEARDAQLARERETSPRTKFAIDAAALGVLVLLIWIALTLR